MQSLSKYNKGVRYLLCTTDFLNMLGLYKRKKKKGTSIVNAFKKIISKERKPDKI